MSVREVIQSPEPQGTDEVVEWEVDVTKWTNGGANPPTNATCKLFKIDGAVFTDVTDANMTGNPTIDGLVIRAPVVANLIAGEKYRLVWRFNVGTPYVSTYLDIYAEQ